MGRSAALATVATLVVFGASGCGGAEGIEAGARVVAYVEAPLCGGAKRELKRQGAEAGRVRVRAVCLPAVRKRGALDLAAVGADARRATEDSSAIAYLAAPDPAARRFSLPILESADIPRLSSPSGAAAIHQLLTAIESAGSSSSLREAVQHQLTPPS